jgi:hypothetical protein
MKGRSGKFLLVLDNAVSLGSESRGAHDHSLLSHYSRSRAKVKRKVVPVQVSNMPCRRIAE